MAVAQPLDLLAHALGRRDEVPNVELAERIVAADDHSAVATLIEALRDRPRRMQSDCIKTLYEVAQRAPDLVAEHCREFFPLLDSRHNRLVWGAMTALDALANVCAAELAGQLPKLVAAAERGTVITRDHVVGILYKLAQNKTYAKRATPLLLRQLGDCPDNQFPMYAEKSLIALKRHAPQAFKRVLTRRHSKLPKASQQRRVARVLRALER